MQGTGDGITHFTQLAGNGQVTDSQDTIVFFIVLFSGKSFGKWTTSYSKDIIIIVLK